MQIRTKRPTTPPTPIPIKATNPRSLPGSLGNVIAVTDSKFAKQVLHVFFNNATYSTLEDSSTKGAEMTSLALTDEDDARNLTS